MHIHHIPIYLWTEQIEGLLVLAFASNLFFFCLMIYVLGIVFCFVLNELVSNIFAQAKIFDPFVSFAALTWHRNNKKISMNEYSWYMNLIKYAKKYFVKGNIFVSFGVCWLHLDNAEGCVQENFIKLKENMKTHSNIRPNFRMFYELF